MTHIHLQKLYKCLIENYIDNFGEELGLELAKKHDQQFKNDFNEAQNIYDNLTVKRKKQYIKLAHERNDKYKE